MATHFFFISDNIFFFLNCYPVLDNRSGEKQIELQCKQNILNKTMCFYGMNSTYLLPRQHKFLCHVDFVHKFVFQYLTTIKLSCFNYIVFRLLP